VPQKSFVMPIAQAFIIEVDVWSGTARHVVRGGDAHLRSPDDEFSTGAALVETASLGSMFWSRPAHIVLLRAVTIEWSFNQRTPETLHALERIAQSGRAQWNSEVNHITHPRDQRPVPASY
jgi:hypothetical protein